MKRTIFIWDIEWCYKEFKLLLKKLELTKKDKIYLTWDIIYKWPKNYKVLKFIKKNKKQIKSVMWNHELNFLTRLKWWEINFTVNQKKFNKLKEKIEKKPKLLKYLEKLPKYIEKDDFILIHWWLIPWKSLEEHTIYEITNTREINWKPWYEYYKWEKKIIYWHYAVKWLNIRKNTIWLDSWCVYWKSLTAYILETWEIITQNALNSYINLFKNNKENENKWIKKI